MPLDDRDPYWAARFRMTPDQMDALRRRAEQTVRAGKTAMTPPSGTDDMIRLAGANRSAP